MSRTCVEVTADPLGGRPRVTVRSDGPRGRAHVGARVLATAADRVRVALVAEGALLVAGDDVQVGMRVGPGMTLEVVEPAGTVAFDMRGGRAYHRVDADVSESALLTWAAQPFVMSGGAEVDRSVEVSLHGSGVAVVRDTLVLGRAVEPGGVVRQRFRAVVDDQPLLCEDLLLDGSHPRAGVTGSHRVVDTISVLGRRAPDSTPSAAHRLELHGPGTVLRYLGGAAHTSPLDGVWSSAVGRPLEVVT